MAERKETVGEWIDRTVDEYIDVYESLDPEPKFDAKSIVLGEIMMRNYQWQEVEKLVKARIEHKVIDAAVDLVKQEVI